MSPKLPPSIAELLELPEEKRWLGPFRLVSQLGRGGFAPVWLAREVFGGAELRTAAVKLFSLRESSDTDGRAPPASAAARHKDQVIREAQALCRVEHLHVVRFYSMALDEARGVVGLAMEYVTGTALDRRLDAEKKLAPDDVVVVGLAVATALAAVHRAGLVHRDVKPSNVVDAGGVYKLIDFGIASAETAEERAPPPAKVTAPTTAKRVVLDDLPFEVVGTKMSMLGAAYTVRGDEGQGDSGDGTGPGSSTLAFLTGTVGYIDPLVVSTGAPADASSDLYGLGAMLYECLTGKVPASASARAGTGLAGEILDGRARPTPVRELAPSTPEGLARLVDSLVSPAREDRPASADAVAAALREVRPKALPEVKGDTAASEATSARAVATTAPLPDPPPRSRARGFIAAAGALAVACVLGAIIVGLVGRSASTERAAASSGASGARSATATVVHACSAAVPDDCAAQCDAGSAESCYTLALLYEDGNGVARDVGRAAGLYTKACDAGNAPACYASGRLLDAQKDLAGALARYDDGCTKGSAQSCNAEGRAYSEGRGTAVDAARAKDDYHRACDAGYVLACANLGILYERGQGVPKDVDQARALYERACDGGAPAACGDLAHFYLDGVGVAKDEARGFVLYQKACDGGYEEGCGGLGILLATGRGAPKDAARAADLLKTACDAGQAPACAALADLYARGDGVTKDTKRAATLYDEACDGGASSACAAHPSFGAIPGPQPATRPLATPMPTASPSPRSATPYPLNGF